ncbi:TPA: glutamine--fructose-6-phosphate transaminase (isomerizing) [archaeon]|nr:glutamine--fructose-6-phosphate transaminase (isomerizing) [Candidatus Naiadarchaeales archaeon SRR2090159.bin1288]
MCGIIGYVGNRNAAPIIVDSLKKLEYRGYDSAGIATINSGKISIKKDAGYINDIEKNLKLSNLGGNIGIGHTRWATHGAPNMVNAHPHTSCDGKIALIHNGIIENYLELKGDLQKKGHKFASETDTEVFAHLIEENAKSADFEKAFLNALKKVRGSYAFVAINAAEPNKILVARTRAPLIIGLGKGESFVASDIPAFLSETRRAIILDDGEYAVITKDSAVIREARSGKEIRKKTSNIIWGAAAAEKGGYPFFAIKEIKEVPQAVENTLATLPEIAKIANQIKRYKKVIFIAAGTSYHASLIGKYLLENLCKIPCEAVLASEFSWSLKNIVDKKTLVIAVTQSGETADTLLAIKDAKSRGAKVLAITNVVGSSITREADYNIYTAAGPEIAVIATKTFVTQLVALYALAFYIGHEAWGMRHGQNKTSSLKHQASSHSHFIQT